MILRRSRVWLVLLLIVFLVTACAENDHSDTQTSPLGSPSITPEPSPSPPPTPDANVVTISIVGDQVEVSEPRVEVSLNERVRIEITSDRADEVHVHGYELKTELKPGERAVLEFAANIPGVFEVELEKNHQKLFELRVTG